MAIRYCGKVKIDCQLESVPHTRHGKQYRCALSVRGKRLGMMRVGLPAHLDVAIDSPAAYDRAASAAISFALDEAESGEKDWHGIAAYCDWDRGGLYIRRTSRSARRVPHSETRGMPGVLK